jgi:hypothetical protein
MAKLVACPWCEVRNELYPTGKTFCFHCAHRADVPQSECDCRKCLRRERTKLKPAPQKRWVAA